MFPERDRSCCFVVQENSDTGVLCKRPLGYRQSRPLAGLMTLRSFIEGGYDVVDAKILVCEEPGTQEKRFHIPNTCFKKQVGSWKHSVITKSGEQKELVNVIVFDHTADADLTLWGLAFSSSVDPWQPSRTVLLISGPAFNAGRRPSIALRPHTFVDIDPNTNDAGWLRKFAQRLTKREHVNPPVPKDGSASLCPDCNRMLRSPPQRSTSTRRWTLKLELCSPLPTSTNCNHPELCALLHHPADCFVVSEPRPTVSCRAPARRRLSANTSTKTASASDLYPETFTGFLSVILLELNVSLLHMRNMLFCNEWCQPHPLPPSSPSNPQKH